jgi:hypothetical protein
MRFYLILFIIGLSTNSYSQQRGHYIDPQQLTWSDYLGHVNLQSEATAATASKYKVSCDTTGNKLHDFRIIVEFYPGLSWVNWSVLITYGKIYQENLLNHERFHYYTTILIAKRIKYFIDHNKVMTIDQFVTTIERFNNMKQEMEDRYDLDSRHGENHARQLYWEADIKTQLEAVKNIQLDSPYN